MTSEESYRLQVTITMRGEEESALEAEPMKSKLRWLALGAATMLSLGSIASAGQLNLTAGGTGAINAGTDLFTTTDFQATGSGVIQSFVRISTNGDVVDGYNTDARPLQFDENNSPIFTRALPLSAVPVVNVAGTNYREFLLDINQEGSDPLLAMHELQIFVGNTGSPIGASVGVGGTLSFGSQASLVYDMDGGAAGDSSVLLDYNLNSGSGSGDMFAYVKDSLFTGGTYVTLYSLFGPPPNENNDGYEEWAVRTTEVLPVPLPMAAWGGMALCGFIGASKLRRRQQGCSS